ncbi:MAG TPA: hypothetical protein PL110_04700, partial [Candidatus Eremiobacteraeota bacterium]|nr:hypothetical protein [Candidatus Eremiobacteraeota bacterium]
LELIEQEQSLSLDSNKNPVCFRKTKIYDKEGNITGEEEEESFYRSEEDNGDRQHVIIRRTYKFINEEKIQTDEEEFIDCFPLSRQKNIQFSKTYFQYGKRIHKRTDRIQQGDIREEYKDLSTIAETGIKLLFARLLEGGSQEISIRHHGDIFYDTIETEDKEIRCTVYKSTRRPSCLLMRVDLLKGYNITLPLWVLVSASYDQVETQFLFEGVKDSTLVDRFDKTTLYHTFRGTLKNEDLKGELLREATRIQTRMDEEARDKLKSEDRSYLEFKFSDRADSLFHVLTPGWIKNNSPSGWMQKNEELSSSEIIENIIYCLIKYLHPDNKLRRESALERKHTFLPLVVSGATGLEAILGQKFGVDLVFLLWEMLNITGYADGKDKFASLKI